MRILAGKLKGRKLRAPEGLTTRPTPARVRQAVFDILQHAPWGAENIIDGATVLDCFAGTGALGLEAVSRGAGFVHFIENDRPALSALRANVASSRVDKTRIWNVDALSPPQGVPCDVIFLDPPYHRSLIERSLVALRAKGWVTPASLVIGQIGRDEHLQTEAPLLVERTYGASRIFVYRS